MINILEEFANDNLHPNSRYFKRGSKFGRAMKRVVDTEDALIASLGEEEKKLLEEFTDAQNARDALSGTDQFIYGYRLGVLMTMEVFHTSDSLVFGGGDE